MKILPILMLALSAFSANAQLYKWTDSNGSVHYSNNPQDGVKTTELQSQHGQTAPAPSKDDWRERERISRVNRVRQAEADRRAAAAEQAEKTQQQPFNPSVNRSDRAMTEEEMCRRDRQQIEYAEQTKHLTITHGTPQQLTEAQRQEVIRERKSNHALACGSGRHR
jgi:hypothetical protein